MLEATLKAAMPRNSRSVCLDEVMINQELTYRPTHPPDFEVENRAAVALAEVMSDSSNSVFTKLGVGAQQLCQAESEGMSSEETEGGKGIFRWHATAGAYARYAGGSMPSEFSRCGTVLDRNAALYLASEKLAMRLDEQRCVALFSLDSACGVSSRRRRSW